MHPYQCKKIKDSVLDVTVVAMVTPELSKDVIAYSAVKLDKCAPCFSLADTWCTSMQWLDLLGEQLWLVLLSHSNTCPPQMLTVTHFTNHTM